MILRHMLAALLCISLVGCSSVPSYQEPSSSSENAKIKATGSGRGFCGLHPNPVCDARVLLVDGLRASLLSSAIDVTPGEHTLRLFCTSKTGPLANQSASFADRTVRLEPGGTYRVEGSMEDEICYLSLLDDRTNTPVKVKPLVVKASPPGTYPNAEMIALHASGDTVSTFTEVPAGTYLVPNSQVFVQGNASGGTNTGAMMGGALGALIGASVDRSGNAKAVSDVAQDLTISFQKQMADALSTSMGTRQKPASYKRVDIEKEAQLVLLPSALLVAIPDGKYALSFRMTVRIQKDDKSPVVTKNFWYAVSKMRPLTGPESWTENHAQPIKDIAAIAFTKLSAALLDDIEGIDKVWEQGAPTPNDVTRVN
ncbi:hypothetical protein [Uliginosibacterium sediminicola]|uniref:Lipoprotein n=1 Tax=Uliginosibacterium sediminicola TaxID=2024550 RepID=A0ABU9YZI9_9RHOO